MSHIKLKKCSVPFANNSPCPLSIVRDANVTCYYFCDFEPMLSYPLLSRPEYSNVALSILAV